MTVLAQRLSAQLLAGRPATNPLQIAERLLAIQAQDPRAARLAIRARGTGIDAADIDRELTEQRSLVITTLNRGTLHLVRSEDYPLLQSLTTPPLLTTNATRLAQTGVDPGTADRAFDLIDRSIGEDGPQTRAALRERLERAGIPNLQHSMIHLIFGAAIRGRIVRGPMVGRQHAFALVRDWLPASPPPARDVALAELARRYLAGHGPATESDLARWAGLPLRDARAGLGAIARELRRLPGGLLDLAGRGRARAAAGDRACSAPSNRSCWAGARARTSWATTRPASSAAACSAALRSSAAGPSRCGACRAPAASSSSRSPTSTPRPPGAGARRRGAAAVPRAWPLKTRSDHHPQPADLCTVIGGCVRDAEDRAPTALRLSAEAVRDAPGAALQLRTRRVCAALRRGESRPGPAQGSPERPAGLLGTRAPAGDGRAHGRSRADVPPQRRRACRADAAAANAPAGSKTRASSKTRSASNGRTGRVAVGLRWPVGLQCRSGSTRRRSPTGRRRAGRAGRGRSAGESSGPAGSGRPEATRRRPQHGRQRPPRPRH